MTSKTLTDKHGDVITISDGGLTLATRGHVVVHVRETTPGRVHTAAAYADPANLRAALDEVAPVQERAGSYTRTAEQPRPLTADDITDEMRLRAGLAMREWENREWSLTLEQAGDMVLRAALTEPTDTERLAGVLRRFPGRLAGIRDIADHLASEGVRVTGAES